MASRAARWQTGWPAIWRRACRMIFGRAAGSGAMKIDLDGYLSWISSHPHKTPENMLENAANAFLAKEIMAAATGKHVGYVKETETYFLQHGGSFFNQDVTMLLIGGSIYQACRDRGPGYQDDLALIASRALG